MTADDIVRHNRLAWDREVQNGNPATLAVGVEEIAIARTDKLRITLSGNRPLPLEWLSGLADADVLCLACGGGQQVPILAAGGGRVTSFDNSPLQLEQDRICAEVHGLTIRCVLGDMRDLTIFEDEGFDFVFFGLGSQFIPDPAPVWREIGRILRPGGKVIAAIVNPMSYTLDWKEYSQGSMQIRHSLPYSDTDSLSSVERVELFDKEDPLEFSHTLEKQLGSIVSNGMCIDGFFEDFAESELSAKFFANYFILSARKSEKP